MELPKPDCTGSGQNAVHRSGSSAKRRHLDRLARADQVPVAVHVVEAGDGWPHLVAPQRRQRERRLGARVRALPVVVEYNLHRAAGSNIWRSSLAQTGEEGRRRESERARAGEEAGPTCPGPHPALGPTLPWAPTCHGPHPARPDLHCVRRILEAVVVLVHLAGFDLANLLPNRDHRVAEAVKLVPTCACGRARAGVRACACVCCVRACALGLGLGRLDHERASHGPRHRWRMEAVVDQPLRNVCTETDAQGNRAHVRARRTCTLTRARTTHRFRRCPTRS